MEGRLPCNAFYKYRGNKYPVHIDREGRWWGLDGLYIPRTIQMTLTSSVAEVDDEPAWALRVLNPDFIQREGELQVDENIRIRRVRHPGGLRVILERERVGGGV